MKNFRVQLWTTNIAKKAKPPFFFRLSQSGKVTGMQTPQQLSREAIDDFKTIYQAEFGKTLSDDEVQEIGLRLLHIFGILSQPDHEDRSA